VLQRIMHVFLGTIFVLILGVQAVWAVSFGKVDVASKMGEPFYAEIPLRLSESESLRKVSVELGNAADYRILEVYRDPVLNAIRTDVIDDERGPRVTLTSDMAIDEAFFNVVLKVRYGRSTHYKKIPVFLDAPSVVSSAKVKMEATSIPAVSAANVDPTTSLAFVTKVPEGSKVATKEAFDTLVEEDAPEDTFVPYDGWARTARYGPMVYGDTITTVAKRLRVDDRFTNEQVMVALFEKNKAKFSKGNINLIKAGVYLDVPLAKEVAQIAPSQAKYFLSQQNKAWKAMQKEARYAAIAEAQRTRYSSRVRIGQGATGVVSQSEPVSSTQVESPEVTKIKVESSESALSHTAVKSVEAQLAQKDADLLALQEKMATLEARLLEAEKQVKAEKQGVASADDATAAALEAQNKRLELVVTRLKAQLEQAKQNIPSESGMPDWVLYTLIALGLIILSLIAAVFILFKQTRQHPAERESILADTSSEDLDATKVMNADDFEMPAETPFASEADASGEHFGMDGDLEEIPDLTDEETGEIEPFNVDEEPDPKVNYLEDADVYLRYGMEDEAEQQVRMALKLQPDNPDAHAKMVQIKKLKGDDAGMQTAITAAKAALAGSALAAFETAIAAEDSIEAAVPADADMGLTDVSQEGVEVSDDIALSDLDLSQVEDVMSKGNEKEEDDGLDVDFDFSDMGLTSDEESGTDTASRLDGFDIDDLKPEGEQEDFTLTSIDASVDVGEGILDSEEVLVGEQGLEESDIHHSVDSIGVSEAEVDTLDADTIESTGIQGDPLSLANTGEHLNDLDMDFDLSDLDVDDEASATDADATLVVSEDEQAQAGVDDDVAQPESLDTSADEDVSLNDLDMDFDLSDLDVDDEASATDADATLVMGEDEQAQAGVDDDVAQPESLDTSADEGVSLNDLDMDFDLSDLDISTTAVEPVHQGADSSVADDSSSINGVDDSFAMLDDLDAELSELNKLEDELESESKVDVPVGMPDEAQGAILDELDEFDQTLILNDVAQHKTMLDEGAMHFEDRDDTKQDASLVSSDPMLESFESTIEMELSNTKAEHTADNASELDELMKDLDSLLDEDKDKS